MLVLTRRQGEQIVLPGCGLTLTVLDISGARVRVGFAAPQNVAIRRAEASAGRRPCVGEPEEAEDNRG